MPRPMRTGIARRPGRAMCRAGRKERQNPMLRQNYESKLRWLLAGLMLAYPIVTFDRGAPVWAIASLVLFALPLALQLTRWVMVRTYALWLTAFLVLQALLTPQLHGDFVTLPPQMRSTVDVRADLPGVPPGVRHITTDERGFRVNPRVDYQVKAGLRIFAIGGSTTAD